MGSREYVDLYLLLCLHYSRKCMHTVNVYHVSSLMYKPGLGWGRLGYLNVVNVDEWFPLCKCSFKLVTYNGLCAVSEATCA